MQFDADLLTLLQTDLAHLTSLHAPSGSEQPVMRELYNLFAPYADEVRVDSMGNLTATRIHQDATVPHLVVSSHGDEIGMIISSITPDGFLRFEALGGVQPRLLEGRHVWVGGRPGVIGARPGHLISPSEQAQGVSIAHLYIDVGADSSQEIARLGIRIGSPVVVTSELKALAGSRVAGKAIDNRASCVLLLHLLRRLHKQALPCKLTALVTVQEEVGLRGATAAFERLRPHLAVVLDTFPATGTPDTSHLAYSARIGEGALITPATVSGPHRGYLMPRALQEFIIATAQRVGAPYQFAIPPHGSLTDAAAAHLAAGGIPTLEIKLPRRNSHSPVEMIDLKDLAAMLAIVEEVVTNPPQPEQLSFL